MFRQACKRCETGEQEGQLADLLTRYEAVFSKNVTQKPRPSADVHLIPDADIAETDELYSHAATLRYLLPGVQPLVQEQEKTNVDPWMDMEATWKELLGQDITKG